MKTWTLPLFATILASALISSPVAAKGKQKSRGERAPEVVEQTKPSTVEEVPAEDVDPATGQEPVLPEDAPALLASGANALPEPPSMQQILTQGGGPESKANLSGNSVKGSVPGSSLGGSSLALGFGLFLMGAGLGAGVVMTRRKSGVGASTQTQRLKHVKSIRLSPKHQISLIETQGRQLVVGITSAQMTLLATLDDDADDASNSALTSVLFNDSERKAEAAHPAQDAPSSAWDELFTSALKQRQQKLHSQVPESKAVPKNKPAELEAPAASFDLPPALTSAPAETSPEPEPTTATLTSHSVVHETEDYTLEEEEGDEEALPQDSVAEAPVVVEKVARHDGMFTAHDAVHHPGLEPRKVRRSRESDSMLIALAAMREEVSR